MDVGEFLTRPLVARVAVTGRAGEPTVRPVWFLFEDGCLWWLTASSYSQVPELLAADSRVSVVIDTCDVAIGEVLAVTVKGTAEIRPFDAALAGRKLTKYLGPDRERWPARFRDAFDDPTSVLVSLRPQRRPVLRASSISE